MVQSERQHSIVRFRNHHRYGRGNAAVAVGDEVFLLRNLRTLNATRVRRRLFLVPEAMSMVTRSSQIVVWETAADCSFRVQMSRDVRRLLPDLVRNISDAALLTS